MMTHMIFFVVKLLNYFPAKGGVSAQYSPKTILSGQTLNYKQCSLPFGTYCQVHEEEGPRNSMAARTSGAILLGPSSNRQGGHLFLSLNTSRVIASRSWTVLPMPTAVIDKINSLAADQPTLITFTDKQGNEIKEDKDVITPPQTEYEIPGVVPDIAETTGVDVEDVELGNHDTAPDQMDGPGNVTEPTEPPLFEHAQDSDPIEPTLHQEILTPAEAGPAEAAVTDAQPQVPIEQPRRPTRVRKQVQSYVPTMKGKTYQYAAAQVATKRYHPQIVEMILTQLTLKAAINKWGKRAETAAEAEMKQLHWRNTFKPVHYSDLSKQQKETILESHIFLTEKRTGKIKGRTVAGGNKQPSFKRKTPAPRQWPLNRSSSHRLLTPKRNAT
jgi:hypothetical protein